jgi:hypothetical protein
VVNEIYKTKGDIYANERVKDAAEKISAAEAKCRDIESRMNDVSKKA